MKKKLLTTLLSIAVVLTSTVTVFATELGDNPTIAEVLATIVDGFPSSDSSTAPDNAWSSGNNKMYLNASSLYVTGTDSTSLASINSSVYKNNNNYVYDPQYGATLTFNMSEGTSPTLQSITISEDEIFNGTYTAPQSTINEVNFEYTDFNFSNFTFELPKASNDAQYSVDNSTYEVGLTKDNVHIYYYDINNGYWTDTDSQQCTPDISNIDKAYILFDLVTTGNDTFVENTVKVFAKKGASPKELNAVDLSPYIEGFELETIRKIKCNLLFAPTKIADILATYSNFPSTSTDDAPIDAWVDDITGRASYIDKDGVLVLSGFSSMNINTVLTKDNENYKTSYNGLSLTFIMESGVLKEIECKFMNTIATFAPYDFVNEERESIVGSTEEVEFKTYANYNDDPTKVTVKVQLEGEANPTTLTYDSDYYLQTGSTIVKLKGDYVKSLPVGTHTITIEVDGYPSVSQPFKIKPAPTPTPGYTAPKTGVK